MIINIIILGGMKICRLQTMQTVSYNHFQVLHTINISRINIPRDEFCHYFGGAGSPRQWGNVAKTSHSFDTT